MPANVFRGEWARIPDASCAACRSRAGRRRIVRRGTGIGSRPRTQVGPAPGGRGGSHLGSSPRVDQLLRCSLGDPKAVCYSPKGQFGSLASRAVDIDPHRPVLLRDAAALLRVPSVTGRERPVLEALAALAAEYGLEADLHQHDLAVLRSHPDHPGEEAPRDELWGLTVTHGRRWAGAALPERARRRRRSRHGAVAARPVVGRARGRAPARARRGRHEGRRRGRPARARRRCGAPAGRPSSSSASPQRRTAASARSPHSSATRPSTRR